MSPLTAKLRFKFRTFNNWFIVIGSFILVAAVFDNWVADAVAIAVLFYLYFFILDKRPIRMACPHCKRIILSNTPWICRACGSKNTDTDNHSFLGKCKNDGCGVEPKAYRCHHKGCSGMIFFTDDEDETNYASSLNSPAEAPKPDERAEKVKTHQEGKQDKEHDLEMAKLDEQLKQIKDRMKDPKIKTPYERKQEELKNHMMGVMAARELAAKQKAENAKTYKDSPDDLRDANQAVDDWLKRNI